jgi:MoxR-like ATPase
MHRCLTAVLSLIDKRNSMAIQLPSSVDETLELLSSQDYIGGRRFATALYLSLHTGRPLFLEGEAGVGKTEVAKVISKALERKLVRLQCYEGLDVANAVYEWNYPRQMIEIRLAEAAGQSSKAELGNGIFREEFLIKRPLLQAISADDGKPPVLLIDELDRADEPFEAYLLEVLADFQVTIPELGTLHATTPPIVIITSNRTREIHDAIKRRCLYHWVNYPDQQTELEIVRRKVPQVPDTLSRQIVAFVARLRGMELYKQPGIAETIDWAQCLSALDKTGLDPETVSDTIGVLLKYQDDITKLDADSVIVDMTAEVQSA